MYPSSRPSAVCLLVPPGHGKMGAGPVFGLLDIHAAAQAAGYDSRLLDPNDPGFRINGCEDIFAYLRRLPLLCVGLHANLHWAPTLSNFIARLKDFGVPLIAGGPYAHTLPDEGCDFVLRGEADETFPMLLDALRDGRNPDPDSIPGLCRATPRLSSRIVPHVADLEILPPRSMEDYNADIYPPRTRSASFRSRSLASEIIASRGCPNQCAFCVSSSTCGRIIRGKSPHRLYREMLERNEAYGATLFNFIDDNFVFASDSLDGLGDLLHGGKCSFLLMCAASVNALSRERLAKLRRINCARLFIGVESAAAETLARVRKPYGPDRLYSAFEPLFDARIPACFNLILGFTWEGASHIQEPRGGFLAPETIRGHFGTTRPPKPRRSSTPCAGSPPCSGSVRAGRPLRHLPLLRLLPPHGWLPASRHRQASPGRTLRAFSSESAQGEWTRGVDFARQPAKAPWPVWRRCLRRTERPCSPGWPEPPSPSSSARPPMRPCGYGKTQSSPLRPPCACFCRDGRSSSKSRPHGRPLPNPQTATGAWTPPSELFIYESPESIPPRGWDAACTGAVLCISRVPGGILKGRVFEWPAIRQFVRWLAPSPIALSAVWDQYWDSARRGGGVANEALARVVAESMNETIHALLLLRALLGGGRVQVLRPFPRRGLPFPPMPLRPFIFIRHRPRRMEPGGGRRRRRPGKRCPPACHGAKMRGLSPGTPLFALDSMRDAPSGRPSKPFEECVKTLSFV